MKMIETIFLLLPFIMFGGTLTLILSISLIKKSEVKKVVVVSIISIMFICIFGLFGIVIPVTIISSMFKGIESILCFISFGVLVYILINVILKLRNLIILKKNDIKEIYVRDVEVEYSPAVLSYLINQKIETKKDLSATLLNLCAKKILKIEKNNDETVKIIDLHNDIEVNKLSVDEKYAYTMFVEGVTNSKINIWKKAVEAVYIKYDFSKAHKGIFSNYIMWLYTAIIIGTFLYMLISGQTVITGKAAENFGMLTAIVFFTAWESVIIYAVRQILSIILNKNTFKEFRDKYTKKGAIECMKWKKFEMFMEDFTLVKEREYTSIDVLGRYLSYSIVLGINTKCDNELYEKIKKQYTFDFNIFDNI